MNEPFFNSPENRARLAVEIPKWLGTPFLESCGGRARAGVAADCCWVAVPMQQIGAVGAVPWPARYVSRGGGPAMLDILLDILDGTERLMCIWSKVLSSCPAAAVPLIPGDVLLYSTGFRLHHLGLLINETQLVHCWAGKIQLASVADQRERFLYAIYRAFILNTEPAPHANQS